MILGRVKHEPVISGSYTSQAFSVNAFFLE